jgi:hypothetical protein
MNLSFCRVVCPLLCTLLLLSLSGCGSGKVLATGKVVEKGVPLKVSDKGFLTVKFLSIDPAAGGAVYPTKVNKEDGTFVIIGPDDRGIPPGKYKVAIQLVDNYPKGKDRFQGKFSDANTKLEKEVTGKEEIIIDVGS